MNAIFDLTKKEMPALKKFIARQFHDRYILLNEQFFDWQYLHNPLNTFSEYSVKIIKYKDEVLGYCGVIPIDLKVGKREIRAGVFANLMIDEKLRGFGFGTLLVKEVLSSFPLSFINGYGPKLQKVCQKLPGWTEMGDLTRLIGVINKDSAQVLAGTTENFIPLKIRTKTDYHLKLVKQFGKEIDAFWSTVKERYPVTVVRSTNYLNWRYLQAPFVEYLLYEYIDEVKLTAYCVVRLESCNYQAKSFRIARIVDLISVPSGEKQMIAAVLSDLKKRKIDLTDYFSSGTFHHQSLLAAGFQYHHKQPYQSVPQLFNPVDRSRRSINWIAYSKNSPGYAKLFADPKHWYVTKGDGDQDRAN